MGKDVALGWLRHAGGERLAVVQSVLPAARGRSASRCAGSVNLDLDLAFGFDSFGARRFADAGFDPSKTALILDGLFISDTGKADGSGKDVDEVTLQSRDRGVRQRELGVASAGVGGGIGATIGLDLSDPNDDGKIRGDRIRAHAGDEPALLCSTPDGKLTAGISAFVKVGFGFFSLTKHFNIAEVTLLDFSFGCDPDAQQPPVLASQSGDVLTLNMGPRADDRRSVNIKDEDENFKVTHVSGTAGNGR